MPTFVDIHFADFSLKHITNALSGSHISNAHIYRYIIQ
jgi:hypothetical protein